MATVRMKNGNQYADVFDSPTSIADAQSKGWELCEDKPKEIKVEKTEVKTPKTKRQ